MAGKIIVLEGTDASGKTTQFKLLHERLAGEGFNIRAVTFPRYEEESSALVRMYLRGEFGKSPSDVNAYAASSFFAVDRCASYLKDWKNFHDSGGIVLIDRYTTSNAIYQASKLHMDKRLEFCAWLFDFEYRLLGLPKPDNVLFLDMPPEYAMKLLAGRLGKTRDIHERDYEYLKECYETAELLTKEYSWDRISCVSNGIIRQIKDIHEDIHGLIKNRLRGDLC